MGDSAIQNIANKYKAELAAKGQRFDGNQGIIQQQAPQQAPEPQLCPHCGNDPAVPPEGNAQAPQQADLTPIQDRINFPK